MVLRVPDDGDSVSFLQMNACVMKMRTAMMQKQHHPGFFQDLSLVQKDVSDGNQWNVHIISPEERQIDQPIDEGW